MKKTLLLIVLLLLPISALIAANENAIWDDSSVPSMLGVYGGYTKRLQLNSSGNLIVSDSSYSSKISTGTYGSTLTAPITVSPTYSVTGFSLSVVGGTLTAITSIEGGTLSLGNGSINTFTREYKVPTASWSITINSLTAGATAYYSIDGVK